LTERKIFISSRVIKLADFGCYILQRIQYLEVGEAKETKTKKSSGNGSFLE